MLPPAQVGSVNRPFPVASNNQTFGPLCGTHCNWISVVPAGSTEGIRIHWRSVSVGDDSLQLMVVSEPAPSVTSAVKCRSPAAPWRRVDGNLAAAVQSRLSERMKGGEHHLSSVMRLWVWRLPTRRVAR